MQTKCVRGEWISKFGFLAARLYVVMIGKLTNGILVIPITGARLAKAYAVIIQRYHNSHANIEDSSEAAQLFLTHLP